MRKRRAFKILIIVVVLAVLGAGAYFGLQVYNSTVTTLHETTEAQAEEIEMLYSDLDYYESILGEEYCYSTDLKAGAVVTENDIMKITVVNTNIPANIIKDPEDVVGKTVKIAVANGDYVTVDNLEDYEIKNDERELDVILDEIPIALEEGDFIDVRISFPLGQDYIAMSHKKVIGIYDNVIKLNASQEDIYTYESMKTDAAIYSATKIYCIKYLEPGIQTAAVTYYPTSLEIMQTKLMDKNIDTSDFEEEIDNRLVLETQLNTSDKVDKRKTVTSDKSSLLSDFNSAKQSYQRLQEQKAKEAAKNNK